MLADKVYSPAPVGSWTGCSECHHWNESRQSELA